MHRFCNERHASYDRTESNGLEPAFTSLSPERAPRQNWCAFSVGRTGFLDSLVFGWEDGQSCLRTELYIDTGDKQRNKAAFDQLATGKHVIDARFPGPLLWTRRDDIRASRIYARPKGSLARMLQ